MTDRATMTKAEEQQWAIDKLRELLREGDRISTVFVAGRGQRDWVECFFPTVYDSRLEISRITYWVALATGRKMSEHGIPMGGGNYDKAHEVVSDLARVLFGDERALTRDRMLTVSR